MTGGGGFIGSHLAHYLHEKGNFVRVVDLKFNGHGLRPYCDEELLLDLRDPGNCLRATESMDQVYNLAANMGGIGFITEVGAEVMRDNFLINVNMLEAARQNRAKMRVVRYHNIYGPDGTYKGGREKSPAALCRKVAEATSPGSIAIWGDGKQTRSYCYIDDAIDGTIRLMESDFSEPMNIGSDRLVSIDEMADIIIRISRKSISKQYDPSGPQGVRGRNADIRLAKSVLGWEPKVSFEAGLKNTYGWIAAQCSEDRHEVEIMPRTQ